MATEVEIRKILKDRYDIFARQILRIISKTETGEDGLQFLSFNKAQKYLHDCLEQQKKDTGKVRAIVLKGRQQGCSTYVAGRFYHDVIHNKGIKAFVMAHDTNTTGILFETIKRFLDKSPPALKPSTSKDNQNLLFFDKINSSFRIGTAGNQKIGRGMTIHRLHGSEVGFWEKGAELAQGLLQAVPPMDGTEIILESTANGKNNFYHHQWTSAIKGESEFQAIFLPWYWQDEYRIKTKKNFIITKEEKEIKEIYLLDDEQLNFRRVRIVNMSEGGDDGAWKFKREYPLSAVEAFNTSTTHSFIKESDILHARSFITERDSKESIVMGVDPARFGDDKTKMIFRQGNVAWGLASFSGLDNVQIANKVESVLLKHSEIEMVNIDLGGGQGIVDILHDKGFYDRVRGVHFGEEANMKERYFNKRAEMWGEIRAWLHTRIVTIPSDDELHADLVAPEYFYKKDRIIQLEPKEKTKRRLGRSPDAGDALALTFADSYYSLDAIS